MSETNLDFDSVKKKITNLKISLLHRCLDIMSSSIDGGIQLQVNGLRCDSGHDSYIFDSFVKIQGVLQCICQQGTIDTT